MRIASIVAASILTPQIASARVIHVNECVVSMGGFCPVETTFGLVAVIAVLLVAGLPLRFFLRQRIKARIAQNPIEGPTEAERFLYRNAGRMTLIPIGILIVLMVVNQ